MKLRQLMSLLLVAFMLLALCAACSENPVENPEVTTEKPNDEQPGEDKTDEGETPSDPRYDDNGYWKDDLPEDLNFSGTTIKFLYWEDVERDEYFVERESGDLVKDAIYDRNLKVEERLKVKLEYTGVPGNYNNQAGFVAAVDNDVKGGGTFDIVSGYSLTGATLAINGLSRDLLAMEDSYVNLDQPWWPETIQTAATINDKLFFLTGDISTMMLHMMYSVYFNRSIIDEFHLEDPIALVNNNQWTLDKMLSMSEGIYLDNNSDSAKDAGDRYGFTTSSIHIDALYQGMGLKYLEINDSGFLEISKDLNSQKATSVVELATRLVHAPDSYFGATKDVFKENLALFAMDRIYMADGMKDVEIAYGVVPIPKWNTEQENFITILGFPFSLYQVSSMSPNYESGAVTATLECLASESYRTVTPALFEVTMKVKYNPVDEFGDEVSRMYDLIRSSVYIDPGRIFSTPMQNHTYQLFRSEVQYASGRWTSILGESARPMMLGLSIINTAYEKD